MKENLKLVNKKGGSMLRKVLSVLVGCSFMINSVCFAMPSAMGIKATVDNMAIETFLSSGDVSALKSADMKAMATVLTALTMDTYSETDAQAIVNMWAAKAGKDKDTNARIASLATYSKDTLSKKVDEKTISDGIIQNSDGTVSIDRKPTDFSSRIQDKAQEATLKAQMAENIKNATPTIETKAEIAAALEASLIADDVNDVYRAAVIAVLNNVEVSDVDPVISEDDGMNNRIHSAAVVNHIYIDKNLTGDARTDMILHELLHIKNGFSEADTMKEQMDLRKVANKADRQRGDNQMARTRTAMEKSAQKVIDAREAKTPESEIAVDHNFLSKTADEQAKAVDPILEKAFAGQPEQLALVKAAPVQSRIGIVVDVMNKTIAALQSKLTSAVSFFSKTFSDAYSADKDRQAAVKSAENVNENRLTNINVALKTTEVKYENGEKRTILDNSVLAFLEDKKNGNSKLGPMYLTSCTPQAKIDIEKQIKDAGYETGIVIPIVGRESSITLEPGQTLLTLYSEKSEIENLIGDQYQYIQVLNLKQGDVDLLRTIIMASNPSMQAAIAKAGSTPVSFEAITFDPAVYSKMQDAYKAVRDILIQA